MGFDRFVGNPQAVAAVRRMLAAGRLPHSLALAGPRGVGKHTLAAMIARAANCLDHAAQAAGDFCELCEPCRRMAPAEAPEQDEEFAKLLAGRAKAKAEDRRENPLMFSSHPDLICFLPDGPLRQISIDQARQLKELAQFVPAAARRRVFIVDEAGRMDPAGANSLLKILEEPPAGVILILTATNYYELLPTIRSRAIPVHLEPAAPDEVERFLKQRAPEMPEADRRLAAQLAEGAPGRALDLDLEATRRHRREALALLTTAVGKPNLDDLLTRTEALARDPEPLESLLAVLYGLLGDLVHLRSGRAELRNAELEAPLRALAAQVDWNWLEAVATRVDDLQRDLRRNVNKQMAIEALAMSLAK
jgi:DNA polymerase-3 subunit delta'